MKFFTMFAFSWWVSFILSSYLLRRLIASHHQVSFLYKHVSSLLPSFSSVQMAWRTGNHINARVIPFSLEGLTHWQSHLRPHDHIYAPTITLTHRRSHLALCLTIFITKSTILKLGRKEYLRKFYSFFFVRKIFILLLYFSNRRKKSWRGVMIYSFFL